MKLFIITGDPSGDVHAAKVARSLKEHQPNARIAAVGGKALEAEGVELLANQDRMARVGAGSVLGAPYHYQLGRKIMRYLRDFQPDAVLLIDYGVFNLWMAKQLKARGYRTFYFIPPQVWASRKGRIKRIKKNIDHVFCIFPFEEELYQNEGVPVTFVGHPLAGQLPPPADRQAFCDIHGLEPNQSIVGLFPGSRKMEIDYLLQPIIEAMVRIHQQRPEAQFVLAKAPSLPWDFLDKRIERAFAKLGRRPIKLTIVEQQTHALQSVADAAIVASGTATLETALYKTPMVIIYKGHPIVAAVARKLCYLPCIGLPNILTDMERPIAPELLQDDLTPQALGDALLKLLDEESEENRRAREGFESIENQIGNINATEKVALKILELVTTAEPVK